MVGDVRLEHFDRDYLERSWDWLQDPEINHMTMAGQFTRKDQQAFFERLPLRDDYRIWGVAAGEQRIGAAGIKNIDGSSGESFLYIGDRNWWGKGVGVQILELCEGKARELGLERLTMVARMDNDRSLGLYRKAGFQLAAQDASAGTATYEKSLAR